MIKRIKLLLLTTVVFFFSMFLAVGQDINKENNTGIETVIFALEKYDSLETVSKQFLDEYLLSIGQVIVEGQDISKALNLLDSSVYSQERILLHVDSLFKGLIESYIQYDTFKNNAKEEKERAYNTRYKHLSSLIILWLGLLVLSRIFMLEEVYKISLYFLIATYAIAIYVLPAIIEAF